jgi:hypothetical protein
MLAKFTSKTFFRKRKHASSKVDLSKAPDLYSGFDKLESRSGHRLP